jgi:hypothetical protein
VQAGTAMPVGPSQTPLFNQINPWCMLGGDTLGKSDCRRLQVSARNLIEVIISNYLMRI